MRRNTVITMLTVAALGWTAQAQDDQPGLLGGPDQDFMKQTDQGPRGARRGGPGAPRMTAEEAANVWTIQSTSVATRLDLNADQSAQLTQAYIAQRERIHAAMQAKRGEARGDRAGRERGARRNQAEGQGQRQGKGQGQGRGQGRARPGMNDDFRAMMDAENAVFESELTKFLSAEQAAQAVETLGRPNRGWDQMVRTVIGFELDASSQAEALGAIETYVTKTADIRPMRESGDREIMRAAMTEARESLRTELEGMLSDEELEQFAANLGPQNRRGQRGQRGQRGERDGRGFERLDVNGDGVLQKDELPERMQERFADLDVNGDGELDASEMAAMRGGRGGPGKGGARRGGQGRGAIE